MDILFDFGHVPIRWIWVALTIVLAVIEVFTLGLTTIWFALASLVMVFLSFLPIPLVFQILIFLAISAVLLFFTRPVALKKLKIGRVKTNVDSLVGKHALVTKQIGEFERGEVKLNGQFWSARSEDGATLNEGIKCEVVRIEGVQAIVRALDENLSTEP
ncbi:MAG: NfeD family protein [Treponema sp.]|jgi:membrane protein implicated in regulation of membrane protease activity|nr:NfeD family protein [Treponema sp.]